MVTKPPSPFSAEERERFVTWLMADHGLVRADAEKYFDADRPSKRKPLQEAQWVKNMRLVCDMLRQGEDEFFIETIFWIHLYGVVTELLEQFRAPSEMNPPPSASPVLRRFCDAQKGMFAACNGVKNSLSESELICLTLVRHCNAHVYQSGFDIDVRKGNPKKNQPGTIRTETTIKLIGRAVDVDEAHRIMDEIYRQHDFDDHVVAVAFARKIGGAVEHLTLAMKALEVSRAEDLAATLALIDRRKSASKQPE